MKHSRCVLRRCLRSFASAPTASIASVISTASQESPLKDAVKFVRPDTKSIVWTYRELHRHVNALANGLSNLHYRIGDKIVTAIPPYAPEYAVLLLASARLGLTLVPIPTSTDNQIVDVASVEEAITQHKPKAVVVSHELSVSSSDDSAADDQIISATNPILSALDSSLALRDAAGLAGFVPLTGKSFRCSRFPSVRHFVHTGDQNVRAAILFRSLFVYDEAPAVSEDLGSVPLFVRDGASNGVLTQADIMKSAQQTVDKLGLSGDHSDKKGKVVIRPETTKEATSAVIAALMRQSLWLSPHPQSIDNVSLEEQALVV